MRALSVALVCSFLARLGEAQTSLPTEDVFSRFADRVFKIEVQETGSAAKTSIGSGFFVTAEGHLVTNYHVIARVIQHPDRYRAFYIDAADVSSAVEVLDVDVAHDLAIVKTTEAVASFFELEAIDAPQGLRLYSMGHPLDLGLNIVEGTYNGFLKHALDRRIHFTGSLNPGMSGGPAITANGRVVGINVATAGDQVSFLVPVEWAVALLDRARVADLAPSRSLIDTVRDQILKYQDDYVSVLLESSTPSVNLSGFVLPTEPAFFFNCWADAYREDSSPYETVDHQCSTDDYVFVSDELVSGQLWFYHRLLTSDELNRFQFASLYTSDFQQTYHGMGGSESEVTPFQCHTDTVQRAGLTFKSVFCVRGYKRLAGLYDLVFKAAVVGRPLTGLETALFASGVSYDNAEALVRWYLGAITWAE